MLTLSLDKMHFPRKKNSLPPENGITLFHYNYAERKRNDRIWRRIQLSVTSGLTEPPFFFYRTPLICV